MNTSHRPPVRGGGPAGLEAASLAAEAGHRVVMFEAQNRLGGALVLASTVHSDNERFLNWLLDEVERLPVDVRLGARADVDAIKAERPDAVILATGARIENPAIPGIEQARVLTAALIRQVAAGIVSVEEGHRLSGWQKMLVAKLMPLLQRVLSPKALRRLTRLWMPLGGEVVIVGADLAAHPGLIVGATSSAAEAVARISAGDR